MRTRGIVTSQVLGASGQQERICFATLQSGEASFSEKKEKQTLKTRKHSAGLAESAVSQTARLAGQLIVADADATRETPIHAITFECTPIPTMSAASPVPAEALLKLALGLHGPACWFLPAFLPQGQAQCRRERKKLLSSNPNTCGLRCQSRSRPSTLVSHTEPSKPSVNMQGASLLVSRAYSFDAGR